MKKISIINQFHLIPSLWNAYINSFIKSNTYNYLCNFINNEQSNGKLIYPIDIFYALKLTLPNYIKVIILGQDPYYSINNYGIPLANGLAFSVNKFLNLPPSLQNILKEVSENFKINIPDHGYLKSWACNGVLLLNTILTVEHNKPLSHCKKGWEQFTDTLIYQIAVRHRYLVFMLWGSHAKSKRTLINQASKYHLILEASHPSPLSAYKGFFGCQHFLLANKYLNLHGKEGIDWKL